MVAGRQRLAAVDRAAAAAGLRRDLPLTDARARVPELVVAPADAAADLAALERLAFWILRRYSPIVAVDPPDGLWLDVAGMGQLFGGEDELLAELGHALTAAGLSFRMAAADAPGAAWAAARYAPEPASHGRLVIGPGQEGAVLDALPIEALRLASDQASALRRLGIETIAELRRLPRAPLALRFGAAPGRRLDQASGRLAEPIVPLRLPAAVTARRTFLEPVIHLDAVMIAVDRLLAEICSRLESDGRGARLVDVHCIRVDAAVEAVRIGTARPSRDRRLLARLLADRLAQLDAGCGIETVEMIVVLAEPMPAAQVGSVIGEADRDDDIAALVDVLANRLGRRRIFRLTPVASDVPERAARQADPLARPAELSWPVAWPRPPRLLDRPEAIDVIAEMPDQPPAAFRWRGVRRRVRRADGPERITGEWWRRDAELTAVRDYWQVEAEDGSRYWLYRSGDGVRPDTGSLRWFLHGVFG